MHLMVFLRFYPLLQIIMLRVFSQTALWQPVSYQYITENTQVHLFVPANNSEIVHDLLQKHTITHEYVSENTPTSGLYLSYECTVCLWALLCALCGYHRVLLANTNDLIAMQTKNDSSDPRSSSTFYERYHSLEDVCFFFLLVIPFNILVVAS